MPIRITGMNSGGLDTDSIIQEMVKAQSKKKDDLVKKQTLLGWQQEKWATLNSKLKKLYTGTLTNMKLQSTYNKKSTTISNSNVAKVVAGDGAVDGTQSLKVTTLAKSGYLTGGKLTKDKNGNAVNVTSKTTLKELGILANGESGNINVKSNGRNVDLELNADMTIEGFLNKLNKSGVSASFDEVNKRIYVNSTKSGAAADFQLTSLDSLGQGILDGLRLSNEDDLAGYLNLSPSDLQNKYNEAKASLTQNYTNKKASAQQVLDKLNADFTALSDKITLSEGKVADYADPTSANHDADVENAMALSGASRKQALGDLVTGSSWTEQKRLADEIMKKTLPDSSTQADRDALAAAQETAQKFITKFNNVNNLYNQYSESDALSGSINNVTQQIAGYDSYLTDDGGKLTDAAKKVVDDKVAAANNLDNLQTTDPDAYATRSVRIKGEDAEISLNGAQYTSATNTFTVNNLTITAQETTGNDAVSITTTEDIDGMYNVVKGFIKEYNTIIAEMDKLYGADSAKGYEPLTSEEKEAMSDDEIKLWEDKIKASCLRRDSTLGTNINVLKSSMIKSYTVNGNNYSLASFGINTMEYLLAADGEKGVFHIDGDKEDTEAGPDDKLKKMLSTNREDTINFFVALADDMYSSVKKHMQSNDFRSYNTMYDDKKMSKEYAAYTDKIKQQEKKITAMEDKYYKQFSAMEVAMSKLNSQQSSLAGLLGG